MISILLFYILLLKLNQVYIGCVYLRNVVTALPAQATVQSVSPSPIIATSPVHTGEQAGRYIVNSVQQCTVMFIDGVPSTLSNVTLHTTFTHGATGHHLFWDMV